MRVIVTASHANSIPAEILCELLYRQGIRVDAVLVPSFLSIKRLLSLLRIFKFSELIQKVFLSVSSLCLKKNAYLSKQAVNVDPISSLIDHEKIVIRGLPFWCKYRKSIYLSVPDLNSHQSCRYVDSISSDLVVYCGGGILKQAFLQSSPVILNAHAGPLPEVRGMNAAEWSALLSKKSEVTIHQIDSGIDTGPIYAKFSYDISTVSSVEELRSLAVVTGIQGLVSVIKDFSIYSPRNINHSDLPYPQYFRMAPILLSLLQSRLRKR